MHVIQRFKISKLGLIFDALKRSWIYILFIVVFMHDTSVSEFLKIPVLMAHFLEHRALDNKISFVDFLGMHYWGTDLNDNDNDRDNQLPFKNVSLHFADNYDIPASKVIAAQHPTLIQGKKPVFDNDDLPNPALKSLFRPPRV